VITAEETTTDEIVITTRAKEDFDEIDQAILNYTTSTGRSIELDYLNVIKKYSEKVAQQSNEEMKEGYILRVSKAMFHLLVNEREEKKIDADDVKTNLQVLASSINNLVSLDSKSTWKKISKEKPNRVASLMNLVEDYTTAKSRELSSMPPMKLTMSNLVVDVRPIKAPENGTANIDFVDESFSGNRVRIPAENLKGIKNPVTISVVYKHLHDLLPSPILEEDKRSMFVSNVFALSIPKMGEIVKPFEIEFSTNQKVPSKQAVCAYYEIHK
jgi:hypothetical protein